MKKGIIGLLVAIVILVMPIMGCTAKYKEAIAQMEVEIEDLEQDVDDLESKNKDLNKTIKDLNGTIEELEARPTCSPTPEPTPELEPLHESLDLNVNDFLMQYVRGLCLYNESNRPSQFDGMQRMELTDFVIEPNGNDPRLTSYYYFYDVISMLITVDQDDNIYSILISVDEVITPDYEPNVDNIMLSVLVKSIALDVFHGYGKGFKVMTAISDEFAETSDDVMYTHNGIFHSYKMDFEDRHSSLYVSR